MRANDEVVKTENHQSQNGILYAFHPNSLPFLPSHMFFVVAQCDALRGGHAHRQTSQFLVVTSGAVEVTTEDARGNTTCTVLSVGEAIKLAPMTWATQKFREAGSTLVVLSDAPYDETDYIRNYEIYLAESHERARQNYRTSPGKFEAS